MNSNCTIVITSIAKADNRVLQTFAKECASRNVGFIVIGDKPSPLDFQLDGCDFYGLEAQRALDFSFAKLVPERHYSRKNIGYLQAIKNGTQLIVETDDDNYPREKFWNERISKHTIPTLTDRDWVNVYNYFSSGYIWPRGYPLEQIQKAISNNKLAAYVNKTLEVLVERQSNKNEGEFAGHTTCHKVVNFKGDLDLLGKIINVKITESKSNTLYGVVQ